MEKTIIIIPARMGSTRLPNKPLADIGGKPMVVWVMEQALKANVGEVIVACAEQEIKDAVEKAGGKAILTPPDLPSGTDRIFYACNLQPTTCNLIINLQGDMPLIDPALIKKVLEPLKNPAVDIATLVTPVNNAADKNNPNKVKAILAQNGRALYFTRSPAPHGDDAFYYHIGIYAYRRAALETFIKLPPSPLELREKLEQLRALEAGMHIAAAIVDAEPLGVDTPEDLEKVRENLPQ
jgi:3-deoxy-manno-octulosonate cytidylyltransferase (CMP-KDO synthetase)